MQLKWSAYWPTERSVTVQQLKRRLRSEVKAELMSGTPILDNGICIESSKVEAVKKLEDELGLPGNRGVIKTVHVEIDRKSLGEFQFFTIDPQTAAYDEDVFFDMRWPSCKQVAVCPWGVAITSAVTVLRRAYKPYLLGRILPHLEMAVVLLVSGQVRAVLESTGIHGLEYMPCVLREPNGSSTQNNECLVARIRHKVAERASHIITGQNYCPAHSTVQTPYVFDPRIERAEVAGHDFVEVNSVKVNEKVFWYYMPTWFVSRRVLEVLMDNKVPGLQRVTMILNEKFKPVLIS
jgi:hypothetical protein